MQQSDQALAVGMQEAEVARPPETFRQHVLQHQPQELRTGNGPPFQLPRPGVAIAERHLSVLAGEDILLPDHAPVKVAPQIDQRFLAAADEFAIYHPCLGIPAGQRQPGGLDTRQQLRPEHAGQGPLIEQIDEEIVDIVGSEKIEKLFVDLKQLLDEHLAYEESTIIPTLRVQREFPAPPDEATADMYAKGFSWSMQGIDPSVLLQLEKMLPATIVEKLPSARADFEVRSKEVWGEYEVSSSTTPVPERY